MLNPEVDNDKVLSSLPEKVIEIIDVCKSFDQRQILKNINLTVYDKENLVVLGRSGTGKSVLIKCMIGLLKPDSGSINILGYNLTEINKEQLHKLRLQVGFSFQGSALYDSMSVKENLEFPLKRNLAIYERPKLQELVIGALQDVGLEHTLNLYPAELSGGMKKRIGIARTLILNPKIMLYDEPTSGLDPITSGEINDLILKVREKYNTTSIIITHDISCARQVADKVVALVNGESTLQGTFDELKKSDNPELKQFFNY
jgi:phospholipid/cholesterol/gamma-HCH transport system ATP-binding protein